MPTGTHQSQCLWAGGGWEEDKVRYHTVGMTVCVYLTPPSCILRQGLEAGKEPAGGEQRERERMDVHMIKTSYTQLSYNGYDQYTRYINTYMHAYIHKIKRICKKELRSGRRVRHME